MREEVIEKNPRERLKAEKHPLDILEELPTIIDRGYEDTPEEDMVRLQWYGLYHDKPRVGYFLLRVKVPGGILNPEQLRVVGELSSRFGDYAEITLRQDIQLHYIRLEHLPDVFESLKSVNLFPVGACGDTVRNITTCPLCGLEKDELFDVRECVQKLEGFFHHPENRDYFNLPRKFKITVSACPYHCNMPEMHDLAFVGTVFEGKEGFAVWIGGGLSSTPRIARKLGIFVEKERVLSLAKAVVDLWSEDPENRKSFVKARFKYMVDRLGVEKIKSMILERLDFTPQPLDEEPLPVKRYFHTGVGRQKQEGFYYLGIPLPAGRVRGSQLLALAELAQEFNLSIRLSQRQNIILVNISQEDLREVRDRVKELGFHLDVGETRAISVACTSDPFCNYSVGSAKEALLELLDYLEEKLGKLEGVSIGVDGCPHACAHHWLNDIGLQATHLRHPDGS
ncbi:MAG: nitrite/sulfite reductase, partial [Hydrogenobacter thermophilus]|nr:nitrite/sulfite reductase [Hydrogenobacter thermophilus]